MLATFANRLEPRVGGADGAPLVFYAHSLRCPVDVWIEKNYKNKYGWIVQFKAVGNGIVNEFRADLFKQVVGYIERRAQRQVTDISFDDIVDLSNALEINKMAVH